MTVPSSDPDPVPGRSLTILHTTNDFRLDGTGITNLLADLMFAQLDAGHRVSVATNERSDNPLAQEFLNRGGVVREILPVTGPAVLLAEGRRLARVLRQERVDVVHAHTVKGLALVLAAGPRLVRRTVFTVHNDFQRSSQLAVLARRIVCVSDASQRLMRQRLRVRGDAVRVIRNGTLGTRRLPPVTQVVAKSLPAATILFVGGLSSPRKGVEFLVEVFAAVVRARPDAHLVVVGNRDTPRVEELARRLLPVGSYEFVGFCPDPREYMLAATLLAVPSFEEPFGLVALEARSCGLPVVASDVGGLTEILEGGSAGVLLPPGDADAWQRALLTALDRPSPARPATAGDQGLERFSVSRMEREYTRLYVEIAG